MNHHIDKRAGALADQHADADDAVMRTDECARFLGVSNQWLEIARHKGHGPKFMRLSPRMVRYRRSDVIEWLRDRAHACTKEYCAKKVA